MLIWFFKIELQNKIKEYHSTGPAKVWCCYLKESLLDFI